MSSDRIVRNAGVSTLVYIVGSTAGLLLVPVLLQTLGPAQFGLYVLAQTTLSFSSLAVMSLNRGFVRSIIAHGVEGEPERQRTIIGTGVALMMLFGVAIALIIAVVSPLLLRVFRVTPAQTPGFLWVLAGTTLAYVLALVSSPYQALLVAHGRLDRGKVIEGAQIIVGSLASALAALGGFGLQGVGIAIFLTAIPAAVARFVSALKIDRFVATARPSIDRPVFTELWEYGSRVQLVALAGMVNRSVDRATLGILRSATAVAAYDVADRAAFSLVYTANNIAEALSPRMAAHLAARDTASARETYETATRLFAVTGLTMASFAVFQARTILAVWLGTGVGVSATAMMVLAAGYGVSVALGATHVVATSDARPTLAMRYSVTQAVVNVVLSVVGALVGGVVGAAVGSSISGGAGAVVFSILVERRMLRARHLPGVSALARAALVTVPFAAALGYLTNTAMLTLEPSRLVGLLLLVLAFVLQGAATVPLALRLGLLPREQTYAVARKVVAGTFGRLFRR